MALKHARAPWSRDLHTVAGALQWKVRDANGRLVATLRSETEGDAPGQARAGANSHLIQLAPELLEVFVRLYAGVVHELLSFEREATLAWAEALLAELELPRPARDGAQPGRPRCHFAIVHEESTAEVLVVRDLGPWHRFKAITNAAQEVVGELYRAGALPAGRRLLYYDSDGQRDELLHEAGRFLAYRRGTDQGQESS